MDTTILGALITFVFGLILIIIEGRTSWFQHQFTKQAKNQFSKPITTNQLELSISRFKQVFGTIIVIVPLTVTIMLLITNAQISFLSDKLRAYEQSKDWKLPETLQALGKVSEQFNLSVEERAIFDEQKVKLAETEDKLGELQKENESLISQNQNLQKLVLAPDRIELKLNETRSLINNSVYIALTNTSDTYVLVNLANRTELIEIGKSASFIDTDSNLTCEVLLIEVLENLAKFNLTCKPWLN